MKSSSTKTFESEKYGARIFYTMNLELYSSENFLVVNFLGTRSNTDFLIPVSVKVTSPEWHFPDCTPPWAKFPNCR